MSAFDTLYTTYYQSVTVTIALYLVSFSSYLALNNIVICDLEIWVRGH